MGCEKFGHGKGAEASIAKDLDHLVVWIDVPLVSWVLQVVLLDVAPEQLETLDPGGLWDPHNALKFRGQPPRLAQASVFLGRRHFLFVHNAGE